MFLHIYRAIISFSNMTGIKYQFIDIAEFIGWMKTHVYIKFTDEITTKQQSASEWNQFL